MNKKNLCYASDGIVNYFTDHRNKWDDFYSSERSAFMELADASGRLGTILDVGCALGGLGFALSEKFTVERYIGVDINAQAIAQCNCNASLYPMPVQFLCGDIVTATVGEDEFFDIVFSMSCADWNIDTLGIMQTCWNKVKPGGRFVMSIRLTSKDGINDMGKSYQPICSDEKSVCEYANYVVFNWKEFLTILASFEPCPSVIKSFGYFGKPSATAVTPYDELVFAVFIVRKSMPEERSREIATEFYLPLRLYTGS